MLEDLINEFKEIFKYDGEVETFFSPLKTLYIIQSKVVNFILFLFSM